MPKIYKAGEKVRDYRITAELNRGMMAVAYGANDRTGQKVFFKQYKSPTVTVTWYREYLKYQKEVRRRIESTSCQSFCYRFLDAFEAQNCFFQVFEFLDKSASMQAVLDADRAKPGRTPAEQWLLMAKVLMGGMAQLHAAKLVHSDLKPDNVMLISAPELSMKYRLRIIDMDFSLLTDAPAPWTTDPKDTRGYFGTVGYLSPEHLTGQKPTTASDVFTLGLMLHELLGGGHPYHKPDGVDETPDVLRHAARPVRLRAGLDSHLPNKDEVVAVVHRCLAPEPKKRPTAAEVLLALNNRTPGTAPKSGPVPPPEVRTVPPPPKSATVPPPPPRTPPKPPPLVRLVLSAADGREFVTSQGVVVGQTLLKNLGEEARYMADAQFSLERVESEWFVEPVPAARNETLLNGRHLTARTRLAVGDVLAVGKESKGVAKLPLKVAFR